MESYIEVIAALKSHGFARVSLHKFRCSGMTHGNCSVNTLTVVQLPELVLVMIAGKLPVTAQGAFRLTCRSWLNRLAAQELSHTVSLSPYGDWETKAKRLKGMFPKIAIQVQESYSGVQKCLQLLNSPHCDVVSLRCHFESHGSQQNGDEHWLRNNHLAELQHLRILSTLVNAPKAHARLQLEMAVTYKHSPPQSDDLQTAFNKLLPSISGLSVSGNFSSVVQEAFPFSHLSRLELTLPNARSAEVVNGSAILHLQKTLRSLHNLCNLQLHADCLSIQPSAITDVLSVLPTVTSLKVDSGINPCCLASRHMEHITSLCLGREVRFDQPPENLEFLHLAYLSPAHTATLMQLVQMERIVSLTVGYCDVPGLVQLPCRQQQSCPHYGLAPQHWHIHAPSNYFSADQLAT